MAFVVRVLAPVVVLGAALALAMALLDGQDAGEHTTLVTRIGAGAVVSGIVLALWGRREPVRSALRWFVIGVAAWCVPAGVAFLALGWSGARLRVETGVAGFVVTLALLALAVLLFEAVAEEIVFRGRVTDVLGERFAAGLTIALQTALFVAFALVLRGWTGAADLGLFVAMGVGLGLLRLATGSIWVAVGFHTAFQTGAQAVLAQPAVSFDGTTAQAMIALGSVPFAAAITVAAAVTSSRREEVSAR